MKKSISIFLLACLCVGLCLQSVGLADALTYSEKILDLPDGYSGLASMSVAADGSIIGAAKDKQGGWALLTWKDGAASAEVLPLVYDGTIDRIDIMPDGQVAASSVNMERMLQALRDTQGAAGGNASSGDQIKQAEGETSSSGMGTRQNGGGGMSSGINMEINVSYFNADGTVGSSYTYSQTAQQYRVLPGGRIAILSTQSTLSILDGTGAVLHELDQSGVQRLAATDDTLYAIGRDGVYAYDIESGEQVRNVPIQISGSMTFYAKPDGELYGAGSDGVFRITPDADAAELVMDTVGTLLGDPSVSISAFGVKPDGSIVALIDESGSGVQMTGGMTVSTFRIGSASGSDGERQTALAVYSPIDPALLGNREEFLITTLRSSTRLRKAVSDFQRAHPELKVVLQVQIEDNDEATVEDHIRTLNTDLLAGKGGDVIILDGLPMEQYANRGILKDLSFLLPELSIAPGIASGLPDEMGRVFSIPAQFSFQTLWGKKADIEMVQSLADLVYANVSPDQAPMAARTPEELFRLFFPSSEASLKDEQGKLHFNTPQFEEFLEALYELYANSGELPEFNIPGMNARMGRGGINVTELLSFYNGATAFFPMNITGLTQMSIAYSLAGLDEGGFIPLPSIDGAGRAYTPAVLVGVNATSKLSDMAVEFVRTMFSSDVQGIDQTSALPTSATALTTMFDEAKARSADQGGIRGMMMIPGGISLEVGEPDVATWDAIQAMCMEVDTPAVIDETLLGFILSETENFFDGRTMPAEAGQAVEQRAWYYLNE